MTSARDAARLAKIDEFAARVISLIITGKLADGWPHILIAAMDAHLVTPEDRLTPEGEALLGRHPGLDRKPYGQ